jgi:hypothetical protein
MQYQILFFFLIAFGLHTSGGAIYAQELDKKEKDAAFSFADVPYFYRFTTGDQHEYTPAGQEDLNAWKDMVTINYYRNAKDDEALAAIANSTLENYKAANGMIIKTDSVPKTKERPAEHLIVVIFGRPEFFEVSFARFRMRDGVGAGVFYGRRFYGRKIGNEVSAWLKENGPYLEQTLMRWDALPKPPSSKRSDRIVFLDQTKTVTSKLEWNREIVAKNAGSIAIKVTIKEGGKFSVLLIPDDDYQVVTRKRPEPKNFKPRLIINVDASNSFEKDVTLEKGTYWFVIENQEDAVRNINLTCAEIR